MNNDVQVMLAIVRDLLQSNQYPELKPYLENALHYAKSKGLGQAGPGGTGPLITNVPATTDKEMNPWLVGILGTLGLAAPIVANIFNKETGQNIQTTSTGQVTIKKENEWLVPALVGGGILIVGILAIMYMQKKRSYV